MYSLGLALVSAMRNNLHKSHVGCCYVATKVRFRQLAYNHHLNYTFRPFTWSIGPCEEALNIIEDMIEE